MQVHRASFPRCGITSILGLSGGAPHRLDDPSALAVRLRSAGLPLSCPAVARTGQRHPAAADGPTGPGSYQPGAHPPNRGRGAGGEVELAEDVGQVPVDRVLAQEKPLGVRGQAHPDQPTITGRPPRTYPPAAASSRSPDPRVLAVLTRPGFVGAAPAPRRFPGRAAPSFAPPCCDKANGGRSLTSTRIVSALRRTGIEARGRTAKKTADDLVGVPWAGTCGGCRDL